MYEKNKCLLTVATKNLKTSSKEKRYTHILYPCPPDKRITETLLFFTATPWRNKRSCRCFPSVKSARIPAASDSHLLAMQSCSWRCMVVISSMPACHLDHIDTDWFNSSPYLAGVFLSVWCCNNLVNSNSILLGVTCALEKQLPDCITPLSFIMEL